MARALLVLLLVLAGCGDNRPEPDPARWRVYSSLPHVGDLRDVHLAAQLAFEEHGRGIEHVALDSTRPDMEIPWEVGVVHDNARRAAADPRAMAYVGEVASGASATSMPVLGSAGLAQIAPGGTYSGLTRAEGAEDGEPERYRGGAGPHFARVIPADHLQADATVAWMRLLGVRRVLVVEDGESLGHAMAVMVAARAKAAGIAVSEMAIEPRRLATIRDVAVRLRTLRPDTLYFTGPWQNRGLALWGRAHRADPRLRLMGTDALAEPAFTREIFRSARARTFLVGVEVPPPAKFARRFAERFGHDPHPAAVYGYEAMRRAIAAIRSGRGSRRLTVNALFAAPDVDVHGDVIRGRFGGYRVRGDGTLRLERQLVVDR
jgi:ABC-type branched-subunit amino acid transport system substrate-binding protein